METYNFAPGPTQMPTSVLKKLQVATLNYANTGTSIYSIPHRSDYCKDLLSDTNDRVRKMLMIPDDYSILWMQGGATLQFSAVPMNLLQQNEQAAYVDTGYWAARAFDHANILGNVVKIASPMSLTTTQPWMVDNHFKYVHLTPNESSAGIELKSLPTTQAIIVADATSIIMSRQIDICRYGIIYASCQKNIGSTGLTLVIIRNDLITTKPNIPLLLHYHAIWDKESIVNTLPVVSLYLVNLMLRWYEQQGDLVTLEEQSEQKAQLLYDYLDQSPLFFSKIDPRHRSITNIPFYLRQDTLTETFLQQAQTAGLIFLKGHWSCGGCRANIYNTMPLAGVQKLVKIMQKFERKYG